MSQNHGRPAPVLWLLANQVTTGTSDTTFDPDRNVTRGEFATFLWRHSQQPDPAQRICCVSGLVKLDEFVTETDNGCRTANCVDGRDVMGHCLEPKPEPEPEPAPDPPNPLNPEVDGGGIISVGSYHTCGVRVDRTIACWGENPDGQTDAPTGLFESVTAGYGHSCGLRIDGTATCWGLNSEGQSDAPNEQFQALVASTYYTCGLGTDATVSCWGAFDSRLAPEGEFVSISGGDKHTCAVGADGTVACWGAKRDERSDAPDGQFVSVSGAGSTPAG